VGKNSLPVSTVKDIIIFWAGPLVACKSWGNRAQLPFRGREAKWHVFLQLQLLLTFIHTYIHMYIINY